jgi:PBP1b-binding outer membrane lipoprotein LpoB
MKKFFILSAVLGAILFTSGCSSTWKGVKEDSSRAWHSTKKSINEATSE